MSKPGPISRLRGFAGEVRSELFKCTWPTWNELRQSTLVVIVSFLLTGAFVGLSDLIMVSLMRVLF